MNPEWILSLTLLVPILGAILIVLTGKHPNIRESMTLVTAGLLFALVCKLFAWYQEDIPVQLTVWQLMPGLSVSFKLEPLGILFALIASSLWILTAIYSIGYMRRNRESGQTRFYACFPIALASVMGIAFSDNLFSLFIFYEVLTLSTYPLVTHKQNDAARKGGRIYLGILLSTSIGLQLPAMIWTWQLTGTLDFQPGGILAWHIEGWQLPVLLGLYAFGVGKAALMPLHRWLPAAMVAPTPVSALLHAVAVVKAGVFTLLKLAVYLFGVDFLASTDASVWLMYLAAFTIVTASSIALRQDNLKARLAYSTISQLSYIVLGAALANHWGIIGGGLHIAMHAAGKITLFFCAGAIYITTGKTLVSQLDGIGRLMPFTLAAFFLAAISVIGLPPAGGSWSKWYLALGTLEAEQGVLMLALLVSSLLNIAYLMPIVVRGFFLPPTGVDSRQIQEAPMACVIPLCLTAFISILLFFYADQLVALLLPLMEGH